MNNPFLEQQKQFLNMLADNVAKIPGMEAYANLYRNMDLSAIPTDPVEYWKSFSAAVPGADAWAKTMPNPMEMWSKMFGTAPNPMDFWKNVPGIGEFMGAFQSLPTPMDTWTKLAQAATNPAEYFKTLSSIIPGMDIFTKFMPTTVPGVDVYTKMIDLWNGLQDPATFAETFTDKYADIMQTLLQGFMPAGLSQYMAQPKELMDSLVALYRYLFGPWMKIDDDILQRVMAGDADAYIEFFRSFQEKYSETFEKLFNMMGMGVNRESNGDIMRCVDTAFQAMYATGELMAVLNKTWQQSAKTLVSSYQNTIAEGKSISTFRDFYDLWFKETEAAFESLFDTDEFAKTFGHFADMYSQFMIASNKVMERMLSNLPIPTKTDMDSLYRTVYELRKETRDLRRDLKALKAAMPEKTNK